MKCLIDMQGAQGSNGRRGIGRYILELTRALLRHETDHEFHLLFSTAFRDRAEEILESLDGLVKASQIHYWTPCLPCAEADTANSDRFETSVIVRDRIIGLINPDIVLFSSLFEGFSDNCVTRLASNSLNMPSAVICYDLIPHIYRDLYLTHPKFETWYDERFDQLRCQSDLILAISDSTRLECIDLLNYAPDNVHSIYAGVSESFVPMEQPADSDKQQLKKYGIRNDYVLYTGGIDPRKNVEGLIRGYSMLDATIRSQHQLVIVCSITDHDRQRLGNLVKQCGLSKRDVIFTGFIPDEDLVTITQMCKTLVFPSWHEGFGLPLLEAMSCGRAALASNCSSLIEVAGTPGALFEPRNDRALADKLTTVLTDDGFRSNLEKHAISHAKTFSWQRTAKLATAAMLGCIEKHTATKPQNTRKRLALVTPVKPLPTGIADYSFQLIPELLHYYDIDLVIDPTQANIDACPTELRCLSPESFLQQSSQYDRVVYQVGNSEFHAYQFDLMKEVPGVVVLHDFFLSGVRQHMSLHMDGYCDDQYGHLLSKSHGWKALAELKTPETCEDVVWQYPCSRSVFENAIGVIVHSDFSRQLAEQHYGSSYSNLVRKVPLVRGALSSPNTTEARKHIAIETDETLVCSFGGIGRLKLADLIIKAWANSETSQRPSSRLVFVGSLGDPTYQAELAEMVEQLGCTNIAFTGRTTEETYQRYLSACDTAIQLRTRSRGETSAAVLDTLQHGIPTIINANGSMAELPPDTCVMLPDDVSVEQLTEALDTLVDDVELRRQISSSAKALLANEYSAAKCAELYFQYLEEFYKKAPSHPRNVSQHVEQQLAVENPAEIAALKTYAETTLRPYWPHKRQLIVDISELVNRDAGTGIQRVVRNILRHWIETPPDGFIVEAVYATQEHGYRYARTYCCNMLGLNSEDVSDEDVTYNDGDVFIGLDLQPHIIPTRKNDFDAMRNAGVKVKFVVYDLLTIQHPEFFFDGGAEDMTRWLNTIVNSDGAICISQTVASDLTKWIATNYPDRLNKFSVDWFHLGSEILETDSLNDLPADTEKILQQILARPTFLMVGTIEPRKGHADILQAVDWLMEQDEDVNLVLVGKFGWMVEDFQKELLEHPELNQRIFHFENASDGFLKLLYQYSSALIAASYAEGFGLPLIEASREGLPVIARDIPVFREVAEEHAYFFQTGNTSAIGRQLQEWLILFEQKRYPRSYRMKRLSWAESAHQLSQAI